MLCSVFRLRRLCVQPALFAAVAGCQTYDESVRDSLRGYIGQPVQKFAKTNR